MTSFQDDKYLKVEKLLPTDICKIAEQYFLFDMMNGFHSEKTDTRFPNTHGRYADLLGETLLLYTKPEIEKHTGLKLIPTYSFFRIYKPGDKLDFHVDRESCEISCSITIGLNYEKKCEIWPLNFDSLKLMNRLILKPGDAAIYRGCDVYHGRGPFEINDENAYHIQLLLHYVDANGPYAESHKYDNRVQVGIKTDTRDNNQYKNNKPK